MSPCVVNRNVPIGSPKGGLNGAITDECEGAGEVGDIWACFGGGFDFGEGEQAAEIELSSDEAVVVSVPGGGRRGTGASAARQGFEPATGPET